MSPYTITSIFILAVLFGLLSLAPILSGPKDVDSFDTPASKTKPAH